MVDKVKISGRWSDRTSPVFPFKAIFCLFFPLDCLGSAEVLVHGPCVHLYLSFIALLGITRSVFSDVGKEPISKSKRHETDRAIIEIDQGNHQPNLTG